MATFLPNPSSLIIFSLVSVQLLLQKFLQVLAIINELKDGQSWPEALKHVPRNRVEHDMDIDNFDKPEKINRLTAAAIRENYRKNFVYDLLLNKK